MEPFRAIQSRIVLGIGANCVLKANFGEVVDGCGRGPSLATKRRESHPLGSTSGSTSGGVGEARRGTSAPRCPSGRRWRCSCSASAPRPQRQAVEFGAGTFALTETILRTWNAQQRGQRSNVSWFSNLSTRSQKRTGSSAVESPPAKIEEESTESNIHGSVFNWTTNWYPVIPEEDLDKLVPYPFQLLGRKVVIWYDGKDKEGNWNCVLDICPHRLAPLSEGRIDEQGCIQCSYHGWSFRGDGKCANIPQAKREGPEAKACDQSRSRAVTLPVVVKQGILFLWADENSAELAAATEPPITPEINSEAWCAVGTFRDLPYGYDTGMENLVDPSHIPVAHHMVNGGIMGKRSQASPLDLQVNSTTPTGFDAQMKTARGTTSIHTFQAPSRFTYAFQLGKDAKNRAATTTYCTPTSPGHCRILVVNARNFMIGFSSGPHWWQLFPRWLDHQMMLNLLDGDATLLHEQERYLREKTHEAPENWNKAYFMPTTADKYVGAFRQWLNRFAGKGVGWVPGVNPTLPPLISKREDLLNRYTTHTKYCVSCSKALQNFQLARKAFLVSAALLVAVGAVLSNPVNRIQAVGVAALFGLLGWWLGGWIQMFYFKGYDHARIP